MLITSTARVTSKRSKSVRASVLARAVAFETLEHRRLLSSIQTLTTQPYPILNYDASSTSSSGFGAINYTPDAFGPGIGDFNTTDTAPISVQFSALSRPDFVQSNVSTAKLALDIHVSSSGQLVDDFSATDLVVTGAIYQGSTLLADGQLLTAHVTGFESYPPDNSGTANFFLELHTTSTDPALSQFANQDLVMNVVDSANTSFPTPFTGSFLSAFSGQAQGSIVIVAPPPIASPQLVTTASETALGVVGTSMLTDTATLSLGNNPTGTISFTLTQPDGTTIPAGSVQVLNGNGTYSAPPILATQVGIYTWSASYSGDSQNKPTVDTAANEAVTTIKATPQVLTTASFKTGSGTMAGVAVPEDSAVLSGGYHESGALTFTLYAPDSTIAYTETISVNGDGTYNTSNVSVVTQVGTYVWKVAYAGDTLNKLAADQGGTAEKLTTTGGTITGKKYLDLTGNGLSCDDTLWNASLTPVTIKLYKDTGIIGKLDGELVYTTTIVQANGTYSFANLPAGNYLVQEVVPTGYVRTAPTLSDYQAVVIAPATPSAVGPTFANVEMCDSSEYSNVQFYINGCTTSVANLRGATHEGDTIRVSFTVPAGLTHHFSFVSYTAPGASFDANTASQQQIYDLAQGDFTGPGTFSLTIKVPCCYYQVDFVCGYAIDHLGPAGSNIFYTPQSRLISADNGGIHTCTPNCSPGGSISGFCFTDQNNDGELDFGEAGICNVKVTLTNCDTGQVFSCTTDVYGSYQCNNLPYGHYSVCEATPSGFTTGQRTCGTGGGSACSVSNNNFCNVLIRPSDCDSNWYFGERPPVGGACTTGQTATIGFWRGNRGQYLIQCLNGGYGATQLGNWLADQFPNMFGANAGGNNLAGKSDSYIANFFCTQFNSKKIEAEVLAAALAVYVTDSECAGNIGTYFGFKVDSLGVGNSTFNVGSNGQAFGVANYSCLTVIDLLTRSDAMSAGGTGATQYDIYNGNSVLQAMAINVYDAINSAGHIT